MARVAFRNPKELLGFHAWPTWECRITEAGLFNFAAGFFALLASGSKMSSSAKPPTKGITFWLAGEEATVKAVFWLNNCNSESELSSAFSRNLTARTAGRTIGTKTGSNRQS